MLIYFPTYPKSPIASPYSISKVSCRDVLCFIFNCTPFLVGSAITSESLPIFMSIELFFHIGLFGLSKYAIPVVRQNKNPSFELALTPKGAFVKIPKRF